MGKRECDEEFRVYLNKRFIDYYVKLIWKILFRGWKIWVFREVFIEIGYFKVFLEI